MAIGSVNKPSGRTLARITLADGDGRDCLWMATIGGRPVAEVALHHESPHVARIHRFHVDPEWQHTPVLTDLVLRVLDQCHACGYLKVRWGASAAPRWMVTVLQQRGFQLAHTKTVQGQPTLEFYVDLYRGSKEDGVPRPLPCPRPSPALAYGM
jgi:GNAT superfamily N-acetyltransferase